MLQFSVYHQFSKLGFVFSPFSVLGQSRFALKSSQFDEPHLKLLGLSHLWEMAFIGSLPFIIQTKAESSVLLHDKNLQRSRFSVFPCRSQNSFNLAVSLSLSFKPVRATGKEGVSGDGSEDTLQATIEKSKKVLALQRDLLQKVIYWPLFFFF